MNFGRAIVLSVAAVGCSLVAVAVPPGVSPGPGIRYATDAYPGFDSEDELYYDDVFKEEEDIDEPYDDVEPEDDYYTSRNRNDDEDDISFIDKYDL